jgi:hypothetical protein
MSDVVAEVEKLKEQEGRGFNPRLQRTRAGAD